MKTLVIYASRSGNTKTIAETIADAVREHGTVDVFDAERVTDPLPQSDLVFIGGPTERHGLTPPVARFFDAVAAASLRGRTAVAFDTRLRWPRFLSGSAANDITERLRAAGASVAARAESFFVRTVPAGYELEDGELARARTWAAEVANEVSGERARPSAMAGTPPS